MQTPKENKKHTEKSDNQTQASHPKPAQQQQSTQGPVSSDQQKVGEKGSMKKG